MGYTHLYIKCDLNSLNNERFK